ncbi:MAG: tetratricopeptide repeat protein [Bacteroidota bacterium]
MKQAQVFLLILCLGIGSLFSQTIKTPAEMCDCYSQTEGKKWNDRFNACNKDFMDFLDEMKNSSEPSMEDYQKFVRLFAEVKEMELNLLNSCDTFQKDFNQDVLAYLGNRDPYDKGVSEYEAKENILSGKDSVSNFGLLGDFAVHRKEYDKALDYYKKALDADPYGLGDYIKMNRMFVYHTLGQFDKAAQDAKDLQDYFMGDDNMVFLLSLYRLNSIIEGRKKAKK